MRCRWDLPPLVPQETVERLAPGLFGAASAPSLPAHEQEQRRPSRRLRNVPQPSSSWPEVLSWMRAALEERPQLVSDLTVYLARDGRREAAVSTEESFFKAFWEKCGRVAETSVVAAADFLLLERLREGVASAIPPQYPQLEPRARRRALRQRLDPILKEVMSNLPMQVYLFRSAGSGTHSKCNRCALDALLAPVQASLVPALSFLCPLARDKRGQLKSLSQRSLADCCILIVVYRRSFCTRTQKNSQRLSSSSQLSGSGSSGANGRGARRRVKMQPSREVPRFIIPRGQCGV